MTEAPGITVSPIDARRELHDLVVDDLLGPRAEFARSSPTRASASLIAVSSRDRCGFCGIAVA